MSFIFLHIKSEAIGPNILQIYTFLSTSTGRDTTFLPIFAAKEETVQTSTLISNMKIKEGFELRDICGENIIIAHGKENINFTKIITLNESAALIWNGVVGKDFSIDDMVGIITDEYEIDEDTARKDCQVMAEEWKNVGFIE